MVFPYKRNLGWVATLCCKSIRSFSFLWCKMPMYWRAGMREGGKPLPLAFQYLFFNWAGMKPRRPPNKGVRPRFQYLILMIKDLVILIWLQNANTLKLECLFSAILCNKIEDPKFKVLAFWSQSKYHCQIQITRSLYHEIQILKC